MRGTTHNKLWLLEDDNEQSVVGVSLGADHCAEHEWGIGPLNEMLGICHTLGFGKRRDPETGPCGIERYTVGASHSVEEDIFSFASDHNYAFFLCWRPWKKDDSDFSNLTQTVKKGGWLFRECQPKRDWTAPLKRESPIAEDWEFSSAWHDSGFILLAPKKYENRVKELYEAALRHDLAVWIGPGGPFSNGGLTLAIVSKIAQKHLDSMKEADEAAARLRKLFRESGIEQRLKEAGKKYFACSPSMVPEDEKRETKYKIICWLNPQDQEDNHYGWYTIEDLDLWAQGEGPVIENAEAAKKEST